MWAGPTLGEEGTCWANHAAGLAECKEVRREIIMGLRLLGLHKGNGLVRKNAYGQSTCTFSPKYKFLDFSRSKSDLGPNTKVVILDFIFLTKLKSFRWKLGCERYDKNTNGRTILIFKHIFNGEYYRVLHAPSRYIIDKYNFVIKIGLSVNVPDISLICFHHNTSISLVRP